MNAVCTGNSRERVLALLREKAGDWRSGQEISARLGMTRAGVAKHVAALRREGHAIAAASRRGYKLVLERDHLDPAAVKRELGGCVLGAQAWHVLEETPSTSLIAFELANRGELEGAVILAERQTRGRGRKTHDWLSLPRGLQFSVILRPRAGTWDAALMTRLAALSVRKALAQVAGLACEFKAPNDVLAGGRKICGVLVETALRADEPDWAVLGIGCNVNAVEEDFPEDRRRALSSVYREKGRAVSRPVLLAAILQAVDCCYRALQEGRAEDDIVGECLGQGRELAAGQAEQ